MFLLLLPFFSFLPFLSFLSFLSLLTLLILWLFLVSLDVVGLYLSWQKWPSQAEELHEQIRFNAATLQPGSEMVQSCADLQEAQNLIGWICLADFGCCLILIFWQLWRVLRLMVLVYSSKTDLAAASTRLMKRSSSSRSSWNKSRRGKKLPGPIRTPRNVWHETHTKPPHQNGHFNSVQFQHCSNCI